MKPKLIMVLMVTDWLNYYLFSITQAPYRYEIFANDVETWHAI